MGLTPMCAYPHVCLPPCVPTPHVCLPPCGPNPSVCLTPCVRSQEPMGRYQRIDASYDFAAKAAAHLGASSMSFVQAYKLSRASKVRPNSPQLWTEHPTSRAPCRVKGLAEYRWGAAQTRAAACLIWVHRWACSGSCITRCQRRRSNSPKNKCNRGSLHTAPRGCSSYLPLGCAHSATWLQLLLALRLYTQRHVAAAPTCP